MKRHSTATLMGMTKAELVDYVRMCEHNREVAEQTLAQHIENVKDWEPVRHEKWIDVIISGIQHYRCTGCGEYIEGKWTANDDYRYCPYCGARMDWRRY